MAARCSTRFTQRWRDGTNSLEFGHKLLNYFRVRLPRVSFQKHPSFVLTISVLGLCFVLSCLNCFVESLVWFIEHDVFRCFGYSDICCKACSNYNDSMNVEEYPQSPIRMSVHRTTVPARRTGPVAIFIPLLHQRVQLFVFLCVTSKATLDWRCQRGVKANHSRNKKSSEMADDPQPKSCKN